MINHPVLYSLFLSVAISIIFFIVLKDKNQNASGREKYEMIKNDIMILFLFTFFVILISNILYSNISKSTNLVQVETNKCPF
jgi:hypothetical protein